MEKIILQDKLVVFLILLVSFAAIFSSATFYALSPRASQPLMGMGIYSRTGLLGYTVPPTNSSVTSGDRLNWTLSVTDDMGPAQLVMIIERRTNSPFQSCNYSTCPTLPATVAIE